MGLTYVIVGASSGLGKSLFGALSDRSEEVFGTYNATPVEDARYLPLNVTDPQACERFADDINTRKSGGLVLVLSAGREYNAYAHKSDPAKWADVITTNLTGNYFALRPFLPIMREEGFGRIVLFSSVVARAGMPLTTSYAASKAGLWGLARSLAAENGNSGVTTNVLNLGYFNDGMLNRVPSAAQRMIKGRIGAGRFGEPEEIIPALDFITASPFLNGADIDLDGYWK